MIFPWDELNVIQSRIESTEEITEDGVKRYNAEKCIDLVYEFLEYTWTMGVENVNENMSTSFAPQSSKMRAEINRKIAGKDYRDRIREWAEKGDLEAIMRVVDTDSHRILNTSSLDTAKRAGAHYKTWVTMQDDRVREAHEPLNAVTVGIDDMFVTWDGYATDRPGNFGVPELDINCRCVLTFA